MASVTIYCVQPYWTDGRKLAHGSLRQFKRRSDAIRAGETAARRNAGAIVYVVEGDPEFESWSRPRLLAAHGQVPEVAF
ncbi:MAG: hypothetical protein Q8N10_03470 [Phenylobacterium sp.]|uniref:hypothetical protein n=1 Tax=Phenylobacterium sp. TaxID=1871053 RepID=UPI002728C245|nr:hypothetical protein [Phenylobacterium sp.]MDO8912330.1 hypothetical protein [Phenylobacterium sp.]MDP3099542.1 hypothetical protein [Phenylobacterium sp.]